MAAKKKLIITYHNPNTKEETLCLLIKLIAENLAEKAANNMLKKQRIN